MAKKLLVIFGQSNAMGLMAASSVTNYPGLANAFPAVQLIEHSSSQGATDPINYTDEGPRDLAPRLITFGGGFVAGTGGVELVMGRELDNRTDDTWYVAKMGIDGSSLVNHWNNPAFPVSGGALLTQFKTFVDTQITNFGITDLPNNLTLLFIQGEADGGQAYTTYKTNLETMFLDLRTHFGTCWIILNRLIDENDTAANVRAAQEAFVNETTKALITSNDALSLRDAAHYTDNSYATLGVLLSDKLLGGLAGALPISPYYVGTGPVVISSSIQTNTPVLPPHQTNDILLVILSGIGQNNYTLLTANGFTEAPSSPQHDSASGLNPRCQAWWKRAASGAELAPVINDVAGDDAKYTAVVVIRGAITTGNPFEASAGSTPGSDSTLVMPSVTTTGVNRLILKAAAFVVDTNTPQGGDPTNTGLVELFSQHNFSTNSSSGHSSVIVTGRKEAAGATGTTSVPISTASKAAEISWAATPASGLIVQGQVTLNGVGTGLGDGQQFNLFVYADDTPDVLITATWVEADGTFYVEVPGPDSRQFYAVYDDAAAGGMFGGRTGQSALGTPSVSTFNIELASGSRYGGHYGPKYGPQYAPLFNNTSL